MTALICLTIVAVLALALAAGVALLLVRERRAHDDVLLQITRDCAQERSDLVTRIQRPEVIPPSPVDRERLSARQERETATRAALAQVGTVHHAAPAAGGE